MVQKNHKAVPRGPVRIAIGSRLPCFGLILCLLTLLIPSTDTRAQTSGNKGAKVSVGFINVNWAPFQVEKDGVFQGFALDVVAAVLKQMRSGVEFRPLSFAKALKSLKTGDLDAYVGLGKTLKRTEQYLFTKDPIYIDETVLVGRKEDSFVFNGDVSSLIGMRVGMINGAVHGPAFDNMSGIIRVPHDSGRIATPAFFNDIVVGEKMRFAVTNSRFGTVYYLKSLGYTDKLKIYNEPVAIKTYFIVFSLKSPHLKETAERFDKAHRLFRSTSGYSALLRKYNLTNKFYTD